MAKNAVEQVAHHLGYFCQAISSIDKKLNWNEAIQQLAETHWKPRKPIAGFRYFYCEDCNRRFWHKTRDCYSPSLETCPECFSDVSPSGREECSNNP